MTFPDPATPPPPPAPKKSHKLRWTLIVLGGLLVIGTLAGGSSNTDSGTTSSNNDSSSVTTTGQVPGKCSIFHKGYSDCVDVQVHDQMNDYYTRAEACDIESSRYLQCLNDADLASKQAH